MHKERSLIYERNYWVNTLIKISRPVLEALAEKRLKPTMPAGGIPGARENRLSYAHLEALGRTLAGLAPWLESTHLEPAEEHLRNEISALARKALDFASNPASPDYVNFDNGRQPIVDAAFLAHALLRAPHQLWELLTPGVQANLIRGLKATRSRKPFFCNWLLFAAMVETFLRRAGTEWDRMRVDYALRQHEQWYAGDGVYGDGPEFHWDYYNSYVIQPMLVDILYQLAGEEPEWQGFQPRILQRASRYAEIQERLISPEGTFPPLGRSLVYRCGAFQHLAQMALERRLPPSLPPAQVRSALTAVIRKTMDAPGTFDNRGWLTIGCCGGQEALAEPYISTGSLYLCTTAFLPLGLEPEDPFWTGEPLDWTARTFWSGGNLPPDHALEP
jgi:hypothetical protein